jgi:hypothetical protein
MTYSELDDSHDLAFESTRFQVVVKFSRIFPYPRLKDYIINNQIAIYIASLLLAVHIPLT